MDVLLQTNLDKSIEACVTSEGIVFQQRCFLTAKDPTTLNADWLDPNKKLPDHALKEMGTYRIFISHDCLSILEKVRGDLGRRTGQGSVVDVNSFYCFPLRIENPKAMIKKIV